MVIIGGGVIGVEMASIFNRIGTRVTILEYADHLIATMDHELGKSLHKILKKEGIDIRLNHAVYKTESSESGTKVFLKIKMVQIMSWQLITFWLPWEEVRT